MFFVRRWLYRLSDFTVSYGRLPVVKPGLLVPDWTPGARTETSAPDWRRNLGPRALFLPGRLSLREAGLII